MRVTEIERIIKDLPPELVPEVEKYLLSLLERQARTSGRRLRQDWAGALREYREKYTSLELERKALEWREN
jgi:hypothetical protein